jgi:predicted amidohydrolase
MTILRRELSKLMALMLSFQNVSVTAQKCRSLRTRISNMLAVNQSASRTAVAL